ncbi:MAG: hypothetical protein ACK4V6_17590 [Microthrixaceae bacterium]
MASPADHPTIRGNVVRTVMVVRAVLVLALGIGFLVADARRPVLGNLLAVFWLAGALLTLRWARQNAGHPRSRTAAIAGVVGTLAAVVGLARFLIEGALSVDATLALLGVAAIAVGTLRLLGWFRDEDVLAEMSTRRLFLGVSEVAIGATWILVDDVSRTARIAVGLWALVGGPVMMVDALDLRRRGGRGSS